MSELTEPRGPLIVGIGEYGERVLSSLIARGHDKENMYVVGTDASNKIPVNAAINEKALLGHLEGRVGLIVLLDIARDFLSNQACRIAKAVSIWGIDALFVTPEPDADYPLATTTCRAVRDLGGTLIMLDGKSDPAEAIDTLAAILAPGMVNMPMKDALGCIEEDCTWNLRTATSSGPDRVEAAARDLTGDERLTRPGQPTKVLVTVTSSDLMFSELSEVETRLTDAMDEQDTLFFSLAPGPIAPGEIRISAMIGSAPEPASSDDGPIDEAMAVKRTTPEPATGDTNALTGSLSDMAGQFKRGGILDGHSYFEQFSVKEPVDRSILNSKDLEDGSGGHTLREDPPAYAQADQDQSKDEIDCTIYSQPHVRAGGSTVVEAWAHRPGQARRVASIAHEMDPDAKRLGFAGLEQPVRMGQRLTFELSAPGTLIDEPVQSLAWRGEPYPATFQIDVPREYAGDSVIGRLRMACDGVPCGRVHFRISILGHEASAGERDEATPSHHRFRRYERAFISYATPDRSEVLKRVQMLAGMNIEYFQDVLSLDPGMRWEKELYRHIDESDLFLLFWSSAAKASKWVEREVRYALERKNGLEENPPDILPVILEGPPVPEPPPELGDIHFHDRLIYFIDT